MSQEKPKPETATQETEVVSGPPVELVDVQAVIQRQESLLNFVEKRNVMLEKALPLAISITKGHEWVQMGDYMWPMRGAVKKIMRRFAIRMHSSRYEKTTSVDEKGEYYMYTCHAVFELPGGIDSVEAIGTSTSRKPFFSTKTEYVNGERVTHMRPLYEISEDNIKKMSRTNCITNGVLDLLGIGQVTPDDLKTYGVAGKSGSIDYGGGGGKTSGRGTSSEARPAGGTEAAADPEILPDETRKQIVDEFLAVLDYLVAQGVGEQEIFDKYLKFKDGSTIKRAGLPRMKKSKGLRWVQRQTRAIMENEGVSPADLEAAAANSGGGGETHDDNDVPY